MEPSEPAPADPVSDPIPHVDTTPVDPLPPMLAADTPLEVPTPSPTATTTPFVFHGDAREYFRIWIVNTLLSVATLGVFSAWAKVRKRRYLRGNTELLGHRFDYTADPRRILVGNIIVMVVFLAYAVFGVVYPAVRITAVLVGIALLPWVVVRSLAFNAHNTMWRGLRFRFHPSLSAAVLVYLFQSLLIPVTLGFYYPAWVRARTNFRVSRHRFGTAYFRFNSKNGPFYRAYLVAGGVIFLTLLALGIAVNYMRDHNGGRAPTTTALLPVLLAYMAVFYVTKQFLFARMFNATWNGTSLGEHRFHANLNTRRWLGIQATNILAIVASCGLLYPWAVMRSARYALSCLQLELHGSLDGISRVVSAAGSAVGETAAEFAGMDFGL